MHERAGFAVTLWTYYPSASTRVAPADYATALARLHTGMRTLDVATPHFTDRVDSAPRGSWRPATSRPALADRDRELLSRHAATSETAIVAEPPTSSCCMASRTRATC